MPVGSIPYLTRSGRSWRTDRSSFLRNSGSGTICFHAALEDPELLGDILHAYPLAERAVIGVGSESTQ